VILVTIENFICEMKEKAYKNNKDEEKDKENERQKKNK
jgi:hypothetical protein